MAQRNINIAECVVSDSPQDVLVAPNLGSCLGIAIFDKRLKRGGMAHCLLPLSKADPARAKSVPATYVDSGFTALLEDFFSHGSRREDLTIIVAGGANINDQGNVFEIGKKNYTVLKKLLWKNGLLLGGEHCGDNFVRTISLEIASGKARLAIQGVQTDFKKGAADHGL